MTCPSARGVVSWRGRWFGGQTPSMWGSKLEDGLVLQLLGWPDIFMILVIMGMVEMMLWYFCNIRPNPLMWWSKLEDGLVLQLLGYKSIMHGVGQGEGGSYILIEPQFNTRKIIKVIFLSAWKTSMPSRQLKQRRLLLFTAGLSSLCHCHCYFHFKCHFAFYCHGHCHFKCNFM